MGAPAEVEEDGSSSRISSGCLLGLNSLAGPWRGGGESNEGAQKGLLPQAGAAPQARMEGGFF